MKNCSVFKMLLSASAIVIVAGSTAFADRPAREEYRETVPVKDVPQANAQQIPAATGCFARLSAGLPIWFFQEEDDTAAPGMYFDYWCADVPLNYRIGVEGRHMDVSQGGVEQFAEAPGEAVEVSYVRIPMAVEYYHDLGDGFTGYLGIGPDIINVANDLSDTSVGFHIGSRLSYAFDENWGVAVEAGYMWAELTDNNYDLDLDGAYVTPTIHYTW